MTASRSYISVIQWPDGWSEEACANLLAHAAGLDPYDASLAAKRGTPGVVATLDGDSAGGALQFLRDRGVMAIAPAQHEMAALPQPVPIKRMFWTEVGAQRALGYERWRGSPAEGVVHPQHVHLVVRGLTRSSERRVSQSGSRRSGAIAAGFMVGGVVGAAAGSAMARGSGRQVSSNISTAEVMDLYIRSPESGLTDCLRITSGRFNPELLGDAPRHSGKETLDGVLQQLRSGHRRLLVDAGFSEFRAPGDVVQSHFATTGSASVQRRSDAGAFDFYSQWVCLMYQTMSG